MTGYWEAKGKEKQSSLQEYGSEILKLPYVYPGVARVSKHIIDNESQVSHSWSKKSEIRGVARMILVVLNWNHTYH